MMGTHQRFKVGIAVLANKCVVCVVCKVLLKDIIRQGNSGT